MLIPGFYFAGEFSAFDSYLRSQPHVEKIFRKGEYLWKPGHPYDCVQYYVQGATVFFASHESGRRKIISFHGPGTMLPGYHTNEFKIELALVVEALCNVRVLEFGIAQFGRMFAANSTLALAVVNHYATCMNRMLFETIHQDFNTSRVKLCNLLYLLTMNQPANTGLVIKMTQEDIADILGMSRVQITRELTWLRGQGILGSGLIKGKK